VSRLAAAQVLAWPGFGPELLHGPRMTLDLNQDAPASTDMSSGMPSPGSGHAADDFGLLDEQPRKLAILGLPWETT
jgi:hypothetical protein